MSSENRDILIESLEFILDAVATQATGKNRADIGLYLISLLIADQKVEWEGKLFQDSAGSEKCS
jgi:hypothetical protein